MKTNLEIAIDNLYTTFEKYPLQKKINGCPCCVSDADENVLHTKELKELSGEELRYYAFKAMTTFGHVGDFKHFLPRIFELMSCDELIVDNFVILGKLPYGKWEKWHENEQLIIKEFLIIWWQNLAVTPSSYGPEFVSDFSELHKLIVDLKVMFDVWELDPKEAGVFNLCHLINDIKPVVRRGENCKHFTTAEVNYLVDWLLVKVELLEEAYLHYVTIYPEGSWEIARAIDILKDDFEKYKT